MSQDEGLYTPTMLDYESDEVLLVQASGHDKWFLDTLDALKVEWETIPGASKWIQFEIPSFKLQWLVHGYADVTIEILE